MSKIEKALSKARGESENRQVPVLVPVEDTENNVSPGTDLVAKQTGFAVSIENIQRMVQNESELLSADDLSQRGFIRPEQSTDPLVQVFRELRTKIIQQNRGRNSVILVTAAIERSGSSFVAQNLGAAFAFDHGKTALLIDCNLKNPSVHRLLANAAAPGLTDYLEKTDIDISEIVHPVGISRYRVISAGGQREIPAEYFASPKMGHLIESVRQRYDERFIILDGPPMSDIADIRILSEFCDFVLVVARYGRISHTQIEDCLKVVGNKMLGIVFNDEPRIPRFG